jgi:hypothetical protein
MRARESGSWVDPVGGKVPTICRACSNMIPAGTERVVEVAFATPTHSFKRFRHVGCAAASGNQPPKPPVKSLSTRVCTIRKATRDHVSAKTLSQMQRGMRAFVTREAVPVGLESEMC